MFIPPGFTSRFITTQYGRMVYYTPEGEPWAAPDRADGKESLVFLHGLGGGSSAYEWSKVYPAFAADYRVLAPDLIGWGRSDHPARDYQTEDYIAIITDFMEKTCSGPTTVIASALTAAFTVRAAINRPDLFKSLIVTTLAGLAEFGQDYRRSGFAQFAQLTSLPVLSQLIYNTGVANSFGIRSYLEQRQFAQPERIYPEIVEAYLKSAQQNNAEYAALSFVRGDLCFDLSQYISQLTIPTAIIWGRGSEFTGPEIGRRLMEMNPQAIRIFYQLDDVGFTPQLELPGVTIGLIREFLPRLEANATVTH
ncbi:MULTISPECIES: alpha/beta hydrolase [Cyanophyceae]|uniref:alpha/beta fold hydrolase n=1 Tax=Cyanophyceae TaxID=3028117 RepID=UPI001686830C|nr:MULTISPECIES: alpha/beta hydrolase [unclassified Phormidium]MBD1918244.1 alpha/beta hydrolase [Phormidium sp. FACHB-77]MBD2030276.1 alpha/beta hydrolase [Phormidium sp. FACHB-322]MBD2051352.1 alpha/beta hydrolase [Leptolyngbya sp. FACHB-60]